MQLNKFFTGVLVAVGLAIFAAPQIQQLADEVCKELDVLFTRKKVDMSFSVSLEMARVALRRAESIYDSQLGSK